MIRQHNCNFSVILFVLYKKLIKRLFDSYRFATMDVFDKREHIINVAEEHFSRQGFEGTSIRALCKSAGVNVAMINYYFGSKNGLFEALVKSKIAFMKGKLSELVIDNTKTPLHKINLIISAYVNRFFDHQGFYLTLHREISMVQRQKMHGKIIEILIDNAKYVKQILLDGIKRKQFRKVDVEMTIGTLLGSINQALLNEDMCRLLCEKNKHFKPYEDPKFRKRLIDHLKELMKAYLVK